MRNTYVCALLCAFCIAPSVCAQQAVFDEYRKAAGDYAALFSGRIESSYSPQKYLNHPYWATDEFRNGDVCYCGQLYTDLQLRYDTYKKSLIVATPERQLLLEADIRKVDYFIMDGQKFVPQGERYAALLYESPRMRLTQYIVTTIDMQARKENRYYSRFKGKVYFNLRKDGTDYTITSRSGFLKLFPEHKKQLKAFCRRERLNFREFGAQSMAVLTEYTDSLIHKQ